MDRRFNTTSTKKYDLDGRTHYPLDIFDLRLDPFSFRLYCLIIRRAGAHRNFFQSVSTLATDLHAQRRNIQTHLSILEENKLLRFRHSTNQVKEYKVLHSPASEPPYVAVPNWWVMMRCDLPDAPFRLLAEYLKRSFPVYRTPVGGIIRPNVLPKLDAGSFLPGELVDGSEKVAKLTRKHLVAETWQQVHFPLPNDKQQARICGLGIDQSLSGHRGVRRARTWLVREGLLKPWNDSYLITGRALWTE